MKKIYSYKLKELIVKNVQYKIIAILISIVVWVFIISEENIEKTIRVPLKINKSDHTVVVNDVTKEVAVTVSGSRSIIKSLQSLNLFAEINIDDNSLGLGSYRILPEKMNIPQYLEVNSINPASVLINLEELVQKEVPVIPRFQGTLPHGYMIKRYKVTPENVYIEGAERFVNKTRKVYLKVIDLSSMTQIPESGTMTIKTLADFNTKNIWLKNQENFEVELTIQRLKVGMMDDTQSSF